MVNNCNDIISNSKCFCFSEEFVEFDTLPKGFYTCHDFGKEQIISGVIRMHSAIVIDAFLLFLKGTVVFLSNAAHPAIAQRQCHVLTPLGYVIHLPYRSKSRRV